MNKNPIRSLLLISVCLCAFGCQSVFLRRDEDSIRRSLLKEKPLGTPMKDVETWVKAKDWINIKVSYTTGFYLQEPGRGRYETIGVKSLSARMGRYISFPVGFETSVTAHWGFNEKSELIDVWIEKSADAP